MIVDKVRAGVRRQVAGERERYTAQTACRRGKGDVRFCVLGTLGYRMSGAQQSYSPITFQRQVDFINWYCELRGRGAPARQTPTSTTAPAASTPCTEKLFSARSIPMVVTLLMTSPFRIG